MDTRAVEGTRGGGGRLRQPPAGRERGRRILLEETAHAILEEMQRAHEERGEIPPPPWLILRRCGWLVEGMGGILLGAMVGSAALLVSFIVFTYLLHLFP